MWSHWVREASHGGGQCRAEPHRRRRHVMHGPLTLGTVQGILILWMAGMAAAALVYALERMIRADI